MKKFTDRLSRVKIYGLIAIFCYLYTDLKAGGTPLQDDGRLFSTNLQTDNDMDSTTVKLKIGDKAPLFTAKDQNGDTITLDALSGKKVILYFYPKDNTPGCTAEACSLRDGKSELERKGFVIIGVSPDTEKSHKGFDEKFSLGFTLLADTDNAIARSYGVWGKKKMAGREYMGIIRTTFIIDEKGNIEKIFDKVDTANHFEQIADSYK